MVFSATLNNISASVAVSFIGGRNRSTRRKPLTCRKLYHIMLNIVKYLRRKTPPKQKSNLFGSFFFYIKIVLFVDSIQEIIMSIFCNTQTLHCIKSTEHNYQFTNVSILYKDTIEMSGSNLAITI